MQRPPAPYRMSPNNSNNNRSNPHSASPSQSGPNSANSHHSILPPPEWQMPGDGPASSRKRSVDSEQYSLHASAAAAAAVAAAAAAAAAAGDPTYPAVSQPHPQSRKSTGSSDASLFGVRNGNLATNPAGPHVPGPDSDDEEEGEDDSTVGEASSSSKARRPKKRKTNDDDSKDSSGESPIKYKKRSRAPAPGVCQACNGSDTPEWRRGPGGARTLCNACGLHWAKLNRKRESSKQPDGSYLLPAITLEDLRAAPLKKSIYDEVPLHGSTTAAAAAAAAAAAVAAAASVPNPPITSAVPHSQQTSHSNTTDGIVAGLSGTGLQHLAGGLIAGYARNLQTGGATLTSAPSPYLGGLSGQGGGLNRLSTAGLGSSFNSSGGISASNGSISASGSGHEYANGHGPARLGTPSSVSNASSSISPSAAAAAAAVVALHQSGAPSSSSAASSSNPSSSMPSSSYTFEPPPLERRFNFSNDRNKPLPSPAPINNSNPNGNGSAGPTVRTETSSTRSTANLGPPPPPPSSSSSASVPASSASDGAGPLPPVSASSIDSASRGSGRPSSTATTAAGRGGSPTLPGKTETASSNYSVVDGAVPSATIHLR